MTQTDERLGEALGKAFVEETFSPQAQIMAAKGWVVFQPNDESLWAQVADTIRLFLRGQWSLGALLGGTEDKAYFVNKVPWVLFFLGAAVWYAALNLIPHG